MGGMFSLKRVGCGVIGGKFEELQCSFLLDFKLVLVSEQVNIIGQNAIVRRARHRNRKLPAHIILKSQQQSKTNRFIKLPTQVNFKFLPRNANIIPLGKQHFNIQPHHIILKLIRQVQIVIPVVQYPEKCTCLYTQWHHWHYHLSLVKVYLWLGGRAF
jgi:hypothetical protein